MKKLQLLGALVALCAIGSVVAASAWASGAPENTVKPTILGTAEVGATLHAGKGTWTNEPTSFAYQWKRCNATGGECVAISGATSQAYTVAIADHGHALLVAVTAKNAFGEGTASSAATKPVTPLLVPEFITETHKYPAEYSWTGGGIVGFESAGIGTTCTSMSGTGTISSPTEITKATLKMFNCRSGGTFECNTIEATGLHGHLGYISESAKTVGLVLERESPFFQSFKCQGVQIPVQGSVIGQIGPVNKLTHEFTLTYSQSKGIQSPNKLEGSPIQQLEWNLGKAYEALGIQSGGLFNTSIKGEIIA